MNPINDNNNLCRACYQVTIVGEQASVAHEITRGYVCEVCHQLVNARQSLLLDPGRRDIMVPVSSL
jgi:predicted ATP-dependent Lon-type protease